MLKIQTTRIREIILKKIIGSEYGQIILTHNLHLYMHMPKNIQLRTSEDKQTFQNQATINGKIERLRLERYYK